MMAVMDKRRCRQAVKARANSYLRQTPASAAPMRPPENKPDLSVEDAERPDAGKGTKTASIGKEVLAAVSASLVRRARQSARARASIGKEILEQVGAAKASNQPLSDQVIARMRETMRPRDFKALERAGFPPARAQQLVERNIGLNERRASQSFAQRMGDAGEELGRGTSRSAPARRASTPIRVKAQKVSPSSISNLSPEEMTRRGWRPKSTGAWDMQVDDPVSVGAKTQPSMSARAKKTRAVPTPQGPGSTTSTSTLPAVSPAPKTSIKDVRPNSAGEATVAPVFENRPPTAIAPAATQNIRKRGPLPSPAEAEAQTAAFVPQSQQRAPSVSAQPRAQTPATPAQAVAAPAAQAPAASQWSMGAAPAAQAPAASQWSMGAAPAARAPAAARAAPVSPGPVAPPSNRATQTYVGGMPVPSNAAEGTMSMAAVNPQPRQRFVDRITERVNASPGGNKMSPERAQELFNANPQLRPQVQAPVQAPAQQSPGPNAMPSLGRQIAVFGTAVPAGVLAASMANRPMAQQQQQQQQY